MPSCITLTIQLFGGLRQYAPEGEIKILIAPMTTLADLKSSIRKDLEQRSGKSANLVESSVLADEHHILGADYVVHKQATLAILPPVCGG